MAIAKLLFTDIDTATGKFKVDLDVTDSQIDDGFATAAHVTGLFISQAVATPQFGDGCVAFGQARNYQLGKGESMTATLTLTDIDLDTGELRAELQVENETDAQSPTAAVLAARFTQAAMSSTEFQTACTEFAGTLLGDRDGTVNKPGGNNPTTLFVEEAA